MTNFYSYAVNPLSKSQELELAQKAAGGDRQAREMLIRANIRYALFYAKNFYGQGLSDADVDDEAVIGLIKAVDHFDYSRGTKIITLAKMYIMNEILSALNKSGYIQRKSDGRPCLSLDQPVGDEAADTIGSMLDDNRLDSPEQKAVNRLQIEELYKRLESLKPQEKKIICMIYGLQKYKKPYSLAEIGKELNESKQYVFYIKERAMKKLRSMMVEWEEKAA